MEPENDLDFLALKYGSDKFGSHWYTRQYHENFHVMRDKEIRLLEIGIGGYDDPNSGGASLRMWKEYFPKGKISGLDYYAKPGVQEERITTFQGSQADPCVFANILDSVPERSFDIIIDDGSHRSEHVIASFVMMFQYVTNGGFYIVEDTQTSYWPDHGGNYQNRADPTTTMGFFKGLIDGINWREIHRPGYTPTYADLNIRSMQFCHNMVIVRKGLNADASNFLVNNRLPF